MRAPLSVALLAFALLALGCESEGGTNGNTPTTTQLGASPRQTCVIEAPGLPPTCVTIDESGRTCGPTGDHIPFYDTLLLPEQLPPDISFNQACLTAPLPGIPNQELAEVIYANDDETKNLHVSTGKLAVEARGRPEIPLGNLVGYVTNVTRTDGRTLYSVELEKGGRAYTVIALIGPENAITIDELNATALSIANR